jgi:hypothetical protein
MDVLRFFFEWNFLRGGWPLTKIIYSRDYKFIIKLAVEIKDFIIVF